MSGWCGSCGPGGSAIATAGLKTIAAAEAIPTTRRPRNLKFIPYTSLKCAAAIKTSVRPGWMAGKVHPGFLASTDRRGMLNLEASLDLPSVRVLRVVWAELEFLRPRAGGAVLTEGTTAYEPSPLL